jgi:hypothetical protein
MATAEDTLKKITITLTILTAITATLFLTQQANACSNLKTSGDIKVYDENGKTELTTIQFQLFTPGKQDTQQKTFTIQNTAKTPTHVSWSITKTSITWQPTTKPNQPGYTHTQNGTQKYTLNLLQNKPQHPKYLNPTENTLQLNKAETTKLTLTLTYTGKPTTPETFTLTITLTTTNTNPKR